MQTNSTSSEAARTTTNTGNDQLPSDGNNRVPANEASSGQQTTTNQVANVITSASTTEQQAKSSPTTTDIATGDQHPQSSNLTSLMANTEANSDTTTPNHVGMSMSDVAVSQAVINSSANTSFTTNTGANNSSANFGAGCHHQQSHQRQGVNQNYHGHHNIQQQHYHHHQHHQQQQHHHNNNGGNNNTKYNNTRGDSESNINHVLLITVINPHYAITCDLIHQICSTYGKVNRIVIFRKNGVQAMVEFDNVESAKRARSTLHGCDIYDGCCTLRIEYAKPTRLNVHKNNGDSFDYTNPGLTMGQAGIDEDVHDGHATNNMNDLQPQQHPIEGGPVQVQNQNHHALYNQAHGGHPHHPRGPNRRGPQGAQGGGGGHHQNVHQAHHHHIHQQHHSQQHVKQGTPYGGPVDKSTTGDSGTFHQDTDFNRAGPPSSYADQQFDQYVPIHPGSGPEQGSMHVPPYPRHDAHAHHHHQHHHQRQAGGGANGSHNGGGPPTNHNPSFGSGNATSNAIMSGPSQPMGTVMMVYGLHPERINCDRLFNLLCLYGNVVKVKFLRTKEGCAMVQMGDFAAVDRCVSSLNKITLFSNEIQTSYSKQPFLHDVVQPFILPDGSPSFKDFMSNKNNRFKNPEVASKNRILPPSHVLHFFNAPLGSTEEGLLAVFELVYGHRPVSLKIFTSKAETKSCSGLVTFKDASEASEALVMCNHLTMPKESSPHHPYILRLCFSPPTYSRSSKPYGAPTNQPSGTQ